MPPGPRFPIPYDRTARRPGWEQLPAAVRDAVVALLGAPVTGVDVAGGGFTGGFAATVRTADGAAAFVKAASLSTAPEIARDYANEAGILARLPAGLPVPRLRWAVTAADHVILGLAAVEGRMPALPWDPADLSAALDAYAQVAAALREPPAELVALGLPRLGPDDFHGWREFASGRVRLPPGLPPAVGALLPALAAYESKLAGYNGGDGLAHCDLRVDNVLIDEAGRAFICDWNWLSHGPAWLDLVSLLITAYAGGQPADDLFAAHPAAAGAPGDALDVALAAVSGLWLLRSADPPVAASPHLRGHQRWSAETALGWFSERQGRSEDPAVLARPR
ncbi:aminoglycoside phosphotransferase family protein [Melissospora conviva]|uniref:aminoglycoside phosphotransferase family protein n=1 Tax=Melissospora conviva TaxID=3388432 RepID=UPI003C22E961